MARKSKTQKAKASAARQARKAERKLDEVTSDNDRLVEAEADKENSKSQSKSTNKLAKSESSKDSKNTSTKAVKKSEEKPKKKRFQFLRDVRSELKRVTWPTKADVMRWSGVVVVALVFFGIFVYILDNFIVTPLLVLVSGADPSSIDWFSALTGGEAIDSSSSNASAADASSVDTSSVDTGADAGTDVSDASVDSAQAEVAEDADVAQDSAGE